MRAATLAPVLLAALVAGCAAAQTGAAVPASRPAPHAIVVSVASTQWAPAPAALPAGAMVAVLEGDPARPGPFTLRLRLPDGYRIPPHTHPGDERVTVISGTFLVGMGERFDAAQMHELATGTYAALSAGTAHYAQARGETVIQLNNIGPWSLNYVNPADDPRTRSGN